LISRLVRWAALLSLIFTAMMAEIFLISRIISLVQDGADKVTFLIVLSILVTILTIALWIVARFAFHGIVRKCVSGPLSRGLDISVTYTNKFVEKLSGFLFGKRRDPFVSNDPDESHDDEWISRVSYLEKTFERSLQKAKKELTSEILALEQRLHEHHNATT
jgi:hypothetical protein